jgi:hypothetical protein
MSDEQVRDEALTIFLAGHETTDNALSWTWYLLSQHPGVAARLHAEVDALGHEPGFADLPALSYARQIVSEAIRLYPPAYAIGRRAPGAKPCWCSRRSPSGGTRAGAGPPHRAAATHHAAAEARRAHDAAPPCLERDEVIRESSSGSR